MHRSSAAAWLLVLVICSRQSTTESKNILIVDSIVGGSHFQLLSLLGNELVKRGHNVTFRIAECVWHIRDRANLDAAINCQPFRCNAPEELVAKMLDFFSRKTLSGEMSSIVWFAKLWLGLLDDPEAKELMNTMQDFNEVLLGDGDFHASLIAANYDLAICDLMLPACSVIAHDVLDIPYVNVANGGPLGTRYSRWIDTPSPLSYVPEYLTHYTDSMTFPQRIKNSLAHAFSVFIYDFSSTSGLEAVREKLGLRRGTSMMEIWRKSSLFIFNWDFVLEYPRPTQPNVIMAGGVSVRPPQPLSPDFEEFVQGSGDRGVLVFSVSTLTNIMDDAMADMIAAALARLPLRVVWKFVGDRRPATLGNNTLLASWLPQGDLLGHNKTKLFIFHGGINGAYESIYHGVPVVGIPLFADQIDNLLRLRSLGMAEYVEGGIREVTSDTLYQLIMKVASNPSYKQHAVEASGKFKAQPQQPLKQAVFWIDHVLHYGADHLRSKVGELSWIQYHMLDVAGVLAAFSILLIWSLRYCFSALCCRAKVA
ncbi:UDP-glucuronosyltransferase 2A1-like [Patiria miniata]|uniref:UDP-glucuronosyltransferase n=1 Tax=Patiria miniata TaxID=46514 RepID=A0A914AZ86_PATMI|nr:UDP-glucuronosyltransferase 2A1-like [Patiria miniata]XP_038068988.1 UDP-glucuronosyltransferase 2A1-like [Patiria miniata]